MRYYESLLTDITTSVTIRFILPEDTVAVRRNMESVQLLSAYYPQGRLNCTFYCMKIQEKKLNV